MVVEALLPDLPELDQAFMLDGVIAGFESLEDAMATQPGRPISDESIGTSMLYSSGTTGRPKGVFRQLPEGEWGAEDSAALFRALYGLSLIHISEPTRQEAISYAVFCLKKKSPT